MIFGGGSVVVFLLVGIFLLFNPYKALRWRTDEERWSTRERSYGHPFYMRMRFDPEEIKNHAKLYNRPYKMERTVKNVMYVE